MKIFESIRLYWIFFKLVIFQKLIKIFLFYKKCLVVYTVSFEIGANVKAIGGV